MGWGSYFTLLRLYRDLRRVLVLTENLLYLAGKSLQRRAMRNGVLITLAMSSSIIKTNYTSAQTLSPDQLTALILGAFASYPAGTVLVRVAGILTRDKIDAAAGGFLHLTSHYKRSRMRLHLHYLWHEVFSHDPLEDTRLSGERKALFDEFGIDAGSGGSEQTPELVRDTHDFNLFHEQAGGGEALLIRHDGFIRSGLMALRSPLPMGIQSAAIGFHLGPVEDWYEKGFFSYEDFPAKAFARDPLIKRAQALVDSPARARIRRMLAAEVAPSFWYAFTVRKFSSHLGKEITAINEDAERRGYPDYFDAQHFLWPSDALDREVAERFAANDGDMARRLIASRRSLMREVFSSDGPTARRHLMRMFSRDYASIFELRLKFDAAWAAGRLGGDPISELDAVESAFSLRPLRRARVLPRIEAALERLQHLDDILATRPAPDPALIPLLQVAANIDYRGFHSRHFGGDSPALLGDPATAPEALARHLGLLRGLLHRVRIYHALIKIQILDYWSIVHHMGEID